MALVTSIFQQLIPPGTKLTASGWHTFNAPCCQHRGHRPDTKGRAGVRFDNGVTYHCFNCHYTTGWSPGNTLSEKFKSLCVWMGAEPLEINKMIFEALKTERVDYEQAEVNEIISFDPVPLPKDAESFIDLINDERNNDPNFSKCVEYIANRGYDPMTSDFYWSPEIATRVILPFLHNRRTVGYTARTVSGKGVKYLSERPQNFVYNIDKQSYKQKYIIVCEGPFDALSIDGVALLTNTVSDRQAHIINSIGAEVIVIPDQDEAGIELISKSIKYNWSVAFPTWDDDVNDVADAVQKYGKLFVLVDLIETAVRGEIKLTVGRHNMEHKIKRIAHV